jgi:hypothetical protein
MGFPLFQLRLGLFAGLEKAQFLALRNFHMRQSAVDFSVDIAPPSARSVIGVVSYLPADAFIF